MPMLEDLVARIRLDTSGLQQGLNQVRSGLDTAASKASAAGGTLTRNVTLPIVGMAAAGVKAGATFEKTMTQVSLATKAPVKSLSDLAMTMSKGTTFSALETSDAMLELAKAGMGAADMQAGALKATMDAATIGGLALGDAATYVTNSMNGFGLKAKDAGAITVALSGGADASTASIESLGQGLSQAAAQARNTGLSLQETVGTLAAFDNAGVKGSDAGTSLKTMLMRLNPTTKDAADTMKKLGLDFTKADGSFVSISNVAGQLQDKLKGLSESQRNAALTAMFGSDASRAATILMNEGSKGLQTYIKATRDKESAEKKSAAASAGTAGSMDKAKAAMVNAGIAIGTSLAPHIEKIAAAVETAATAFSSLPAPMQSMIVMGALGVATLGPLLSLFGKAALGAKALVGGMQAGAKGIGLVAKAGPKGLQGLRNFSSGFKSSAAAGSAFSGKMGTLGGKVRSVFSGLGAVVKGAGRGVAAAVKGIGSVVAGLGRVFLTIVTKIGAALRLLVGVVAKAMLAIGRLMLANPWVLIIVALVAVVVLIIKHWDKVKAFLVATWNAIKAAASAVWNAIKAVFVAVVGAIKAVVVGYFRAIVAVIRASLNAAKAVVSAVLNGIKATFTAVWNGIKAVVTAVVNAVKAVIQAQLNAAKAIVTGVLNAIKGVFTAAWNAIKAAVSAAWNAIKSAVSNGISGVLSLVSSLPGKIVGALGNLGSLLFSKGAELIGGLISGITSKIGDIGGAMSGIAGKIAGFLPGSPVKEGPLRRWNRGKAGKKLGGMAADGLRRSTKDVEKAGRKVAEAADRGMRHHKHGKRFTKDGTRYEYGKRVSPTLRKKNGPDWTRPPKVRKAGRRYQPNEVSAGPAKQVTWAPVINNPAPERASESMFRTAQKVAFLGLDREE